MKLTQLKPLTREYLERIGFSWHTDADGSDYVASEFVELSEREAQAFYDAANELYDMYVAAAQHVIDNDFFAELEIPFNLVEAIKMSWENDVHWHLYGRFDLAGGLDGAPIKLIEFNADTPTCLFETAILQWAVLGANGLDETRQFNNLYEALTENFKRLVTLGEGTEDFARLYEGWRILFSSVRGFDEDEKSTKLLQSAADAAGFSTAFAYADEVAFDDEGGIFYNGENFEYWFKLIPWESIAVEEGELALYLTNIMKNQKAIILNPAYTLLFQSKGIMKILWDLYPNHPLLLQSDFHSLPHVKQVRKPFLAREGANVTIFDADGRVVANNGGEYEDGRFLWQEFCEFCKDGRGAKYQAGVFFAWEACALGFRKGGEILGNTSKFVGHVIK